MGTIKLTSRSRRLFMALSSSSTLSRELALPSWSGESGRLPIGGLHCRLLVDAAHAASLAIVARRLLRIAFCSPCATCVACQGRAFSLVWAAFFHSQWYGVEALTETLGINRGGGRGFRLLWVRYPALDPTFDIGGEPAMLHGPNSIPGIWVGRESHA